MIRVVTDSTPWIALLNGGDCPPLELALAAGVASVPPMIQAELLGNPLSLKERNSLEALLKPLVPEALHPEHWPRAGQLKAQLAEGGLFLSVRDAHLLQCAIDQQAVLLSSDPLFREIQKSTGVSVQMW